MREYLIADQKLVQEVLDKIGDFGDGKLEFETRDIELICNLAMKSLTDNQLFVDDIRNKLSPITGLLGVMQMDVDAKYCEKFIPSVKRSVNYLSQREVYPHDETVSE
jgi:hypothetical protein